MSRAHDRMKLRQALDNIEVLGTDATPSTSAKPSDPSSFWNQYEAPAASTPAAAAPAEYGPPAPAAAPAPNFWETYEQPTAPAASPAPAASAAAAQATLSANFWNQYAANAGRPSAPSPRAPAPYRYPYGAKPKGTAGFFDKNVPGFNKPLWQVGLGAIGIVGIGAGAYMLLMKAVPVRGMARRAAPARGYAR